jgi:hypothetical protein
MIDARLPLRVTLDDEANAAYIYLVEAIAPAGDHLASAERALAGPTDVDAVDQVAMTLDQVDEMLDRYERALTEDGFRLPYSPRQARSATSGGAEQPS